MSHPSHEHHPDDSSQRPTDAWSDDDLDDSEACDPVDVLAGDFLQRLRAGEQPTIEQYAQRHPQWSARIQSAFSAVLSVERHKAAAARSSDGRAQTGGRSFQQLGDFRIVRELGRGGMGIVYEAQQESLDRRVALKILPPAAWSNIDNLRKFQQEARTIASLHHTNIVPIHGAGHCDGVHFLVMQLIDGHGLDAYVRTTSTDSAKPAAGEPPARLTPREVARIGVQVADALSYAHEQQVLHRDIKPANILVDAEHHVWVADFGLAKCLDEEHSASLSLEGSLRYMAPERFQGAADVRSDVYALGVTLYELLTGRPAFTARDASHLLHEIVHRSLPSLRRTQANIPSALETVIQKATAKDARQRYATAGAFRDDLSRFLEGYPIRARRTSLAKRWWLWTRRNPAASSASALAALALLAATAASSWGWWATYQAQRLTTASLNRERDERNRSDRTFQLALDALNDVADELSHSANPPQIALPQDETFEEGESAAVLISSLAPPSPQSAAILQKILPLYDQLSVEAPERTDVMRRSVEASQRLGQIQLQLGALDEAAEAIDRGLAMLRTTPLQQPSDAAELTQLRILEGRLNNDLGQLHHLRNRPRESVEAYQNAIRSLSSVGDDPAARLELARSHLALAATPASPAVGARIGAAARTNATRRRPPEEMLKHLEQAIAILRPITQDARHGFAAQLNLARCLRWRGQAPERSFRERQADHQQAVEILRGLTEQQPDSLEARFELSQTLGVGNFSFAAFSERGLLNALQRRWEEALQLANDLHQAHPAVPAYALAASQMSHKLSRLCRFRRLRAPARQFAAQATDIQRKLVSAFPENPAYLAAHLQMLAQPGRIDA